MKQGCEALTEKEKQTLRLLLVGHDAKSIARHLGLSVHTINERLRDARRKLSAASSREAARLLHEAEGVIPQRLGDQLLGDAGAATTGPDGGHPEQGPPARRLPLRAIGGFAMIAFAAALLALSAAPDAAPAPAGSTETAAPSAPSQAARGFLALVDADKWPESFAATGASFRSLNTVETWTRASEQMRAQFGRPESRALLDEHDTPAPPNGLWTVRFRTDFAKKPGAIETISLDREGGSWKVVGIYVE